MNKTDASRPEKSRPIVPEHPMLFGSPPVFHVEDSRTGNGVPLLNHPEWLSVAQLVAAWAKELADASSSVYELQDKLWYQLEKDVINGLLDDPLRNGSRLGLRAIAPGGQPTYIEGWRLYGLFRTMGEVILLSKEAVLDFARRHKLRPPSWWSDATKRETQPSRSQVELKPAPDRIVIKAIRWAYDAAEDAGRKPPNIRELPAAVQPFLQQKGYSASKRRIQLLGEAEEFKRRRRPPGKTLKSERPK
jgi:hypothetical protein